MMIICRIDWREVGVAFELQCLRNCTLSSCFYVACSARYAYYCVVLYVSDVRLSHLNKDYLLSYLLKVNVMKVL